jgi:hypothetical protein
MVIEHLLSRLIVDIYLCNWCFGFNNGLMLLPILSTVRSIYAINLPDFWLDDQYQHELKAFWGTEFLGVVAKTKQ